MKWILAIGGSNLQVDGGLAYTWYNVNATSGGAADGFTETGKYSLNLLVLHLGTTYTF
jgi:hypothetical protein